MSDTATALLLIMMVIIFTIVFNILVGKDKR